jgi:hypothetical protein
VTRRNKMSRLDEVNKDKDKTYSDNICEPSDELPACITLDEEFEWFAVLDKQTRWSRVGHTARKLGRSLSLQRSHEGQGHDILRGAASYSSALLRPDIIAIRRGLCTHDVRVRFRVGSINFSAKAPISFGDERMARNQTKELAEEILRGLAEYRENALVIQITEA